MAEKVKHIRYEKVGPGKFEGGTDLNEYLYELTMESGTDDELGEADTFGWYGLFKKVKIRGPEGKFQNVHAIVSEDSQGFFNVAEYDTEKDVIAAWKEVEEEYGKWNEEAEEIEEDDDIEGEPE